MGTGKDLRTSGIGQERRWEGRKQGQTGPSASQRGQESQRGIRILLPNNGFFQKRKWYTWEQNVTERSPETVGCKEL